MHLILRCTGGFTGPAGSQTRSLDLARLPAEQAQQLQALVQACDFFSLPEQLAKPAPQPWDFQYTLEVADDGDGGHAHAVLYHLDAAPPPLQALTQQLSDLVKPD